jgi:hypothetical protein
MHLLHNGKTEGSGINNPLTPTKFVSREEMHCNPDIKHSRYCIQHNFPYGYGFNKCPMCNIKNNDHETNR